MRHARSSYGILRREPFMEFPEHEGQKASLDPHDGEEYLTGVVDWVLKLVSNLSHFRIRWKRKKPELSCRRGNKLSRSGGVNRSFAATHFNAGP